MILDRLEVPEALLQILDDSRIHLAHYQTVEVPKT